MSNSKPVVVTTEYRGVFFGYVVEMLHYQSRPRLYVTGNLYRPAVVKVKHNSPVGRRGDQPLPDVRILTDFAHDADTLRRVQFGVDFRNRRGAMTEDDASRVNAILPPQCRRCIMSQLMRMPVWNKRNLVRVDADGRGF